MELGQSKLSISPAPATGLRGRQGHIHSLDHSSMVMQTANSPLSAQRQKNTASVAAMSSNQGRTSHISNSRAHQQSKPNFQERSAKVMRKYSKPGMDIIGKIQTQKMSPSGKFNSLVPGQNPKSSYL